MIKLHHVLLAGALLGLSTVSAQAGFSGSLGVNGAAVTQNGTNLGTSTEFTAVQNVVLSPGSGGFAGLVVPPTMPPTTFSGTTLDKALESSGFGFVLHDDEWGTFTGTTGSLYVDKLPGTLTFAITGDYVGGANDATAGVTSTFSALVTLTQIGNSLTQQIVIEVPAIPEPSSVALGAIGLVSLGLVALRKRRSTN